MPREVQQVSAARLRQERRERLVRRQQVSLRAVRQLVSPQLIQQAQLGLQVFRAGKE